MLTTHIISTPTGTSTGSASRFALALICLLTLLVAPAGLHAQMVEVKPYYAVTTQDNVPLKAGDMDGYYNVAVLDKGQILRVTAEGDGWAQVGYPQGLTTYINAHEAKAVDGDSPAKVIETIKVTALKAPNKGAGFTPSWQRAVPQGHELAIGTRLTVVREIHNDDGSLLGYEVAAPKEARGYVKVAFLRTATEAEIASYEASLQRAEQTKATEDTKQADQPDAKTPAASEPSASGQDQDEADTRTGNTHTQDTQAVSDHPTDEASDATSDTGDLTLVAPDDADHDASADHAGADEPAKNEEPANAPSTDGQLAAAEPAEAAGNQPESVTTIAQGNASPGQRPIGSLTDLAKAFDEVQRQPAESAELDELASEFRRTISSLGTDPASQRIREALLGRLKLLELRIATRNKLRELRARRQQISSSMSVVQQRIKAFQSTRGYQFVGRLVKSTVYDGQRLPVMYRIVSVSGLVPHTVGYIDPRNSTLDIESKLGKIVGILGESQLDEALQLRIIHPERIDVLTPESLGLTQP